MLDGGLKTAEDVAKFIEVQTPELGKEIIVWGAASEMVAPIIGLIAIVLSLVAHFKYKSEKWYFDNGDEMPPAIANSILFLIANIIFWVNIMDVVYPMLAPRLFILEKVSSLIK
jgi:lysylphosphatidylglycerol synthetase-like protein (DUF2156 family)